MCHVSVFTCKMALASNILVFFIFCKLLLIFFLQMGYLIPSWLDFSSVLLTVTFFFCSESMIFFACSVKDLQNLFMQSSLRYKVCSSSIWLNTNIVDFECAQGICFPILVVEECSRFFSQLSTFLIKDSISA